MKIRLSILIFILFASASSFTVKKINVYKIALTNKGILLTKATIDSTIAIIQKRLFFAKNKNPNVFFDSKTKQFVVESNETLSDDFINDWLLKRGNIIFYECYSVGEISALSASISTNKKMIEDRNKFLATLNLKPSLYNTVNTAFVGNIKSGDIFKSSQFEKQAKKYFPKNCFVAFGTTVINKKDSFKSIYFLKNDATKFFANNEIESAKTSFNNESRPVVSIVFNRAGSNKFATMTERNIGKCIAIVTDGIVFAAPTVNGKIDGGKLEILGNFTFEETTQLANMFSSGCLPVSLTLVK
jgi:hypothetical protein